MRTNLSDLITTMIYGDYRNIEPIKSTRTRSVRELKYGPCHITHRFPFKGGISFSHVMARSVLSNNVLLHKLKSKGKVITNG